jgi:hypothetical protein
MSSRLDLAFRDRDTYEQVKVKVLAILDAKLADLDRIRSMTPVEPSEYDRAANPIAFNKAVASFSYAEKNRAESEASILRSIEPLFDLLIDPKEVQQDREKDRIEALERQEARSRDKTDKLMAIRQRPTKPDPAREQAELEQRRRDALAARRGQFDQHKMPSQVRSDARVLEG